MEQQLGSILPVNIIDEMNRSFIAYAMAVNRGRALPDVRDGLKPVHRRILYAMNDLNLYPDKPYRKSAKVVGDVLANYHPHGDTAVYDAMVRLAQDFNTRYLLVDGHGNYGTVDGDSPAAMRYTEARMAKLTLELLRDIDKDTVDFRPNFDETTEEPTVFPARYPNFIVNGTGGIGVVMTTKVPPHNMGEAIDAAIAILDNPDLTTDELLKIMPGPDFPTGGTIVGVSGIRQAYETGKGIIRIRAKAEIETFKEDRQRIVVHEIPYMVNKAELVKSIADLVHQKKLDGISDLRDESDKSGMRIVIELKRGTNANVVLNHLYKHTNMQDSFGCNFYAVAGDEPRLMSMKEMFTLYLDHQKSVIVRRTKFELEKAKKRAHILEGLLIAIDNIDEIVALIRASKDAPSARRALVDRFSLSEAQAQAILDMRLQRLTGLERDKIEAEYAELLQKIEYLNKILATPQMVVDIIKEDLLGIRNKFADARRTEIAYEEGEIDLEGLIAPEDMVVTLTHYGYIKRISLATYRAQKRGGRGVSAMSRREEDFAKQVFVTGTHDPILFFTNKGKVYRKMCYTIPEAGRSAKGTPIVNLLNLEPDEKISAVFPIGNVPENANLMTVTKLGTVKKTPLSEFANIRVNGLKAVNLKDGDELVSVLLTDGDHNVILGTRQGMCILFSEDDVRTMGRGATGVRGIRLNEGDHVVDASIAPEGKQILTIAENGFGKRTNLSDYRLQSRGGKGIRAMNLTEKTGLLNSLTVVDGSEEIMLISDEGVVIRICVAEISTVGRVSQGVRVMRLSGGAKIAAAALIPESEQDEDACPPPEELSEKILGIGRDGDEKSEALRDDPRE